MNRNLKAPLLACAAALLLSAPAFAQSARAVSIQAANNTTSVAICGGSCLLTGIYVQNNSGTIAYLKLYNATQAATTCGTGTPVDRIMIPASTSGAGAIITLPNGGTRYSVALTACITTGFADADTTAPAANAYQASLYVQ